MLSIPGTIHRIVSNDNDYYKFDIVSRVDRHIITKGLAHSEAKFCDYCIQI
jgi:hypothetical protein